MREVQILSPRYKQYLLVSRFRGAEQRSGLSLTEQLGNKSRRFAIGGRGAMSPDDPPPFEIEFYADESGDMPCLRWIREDLSPTKRRALGMAMNEILQHHGVQVVGERSWGRQLG